LEEVFYYNKLFILVIQTESATCLVIATVAFMVVFYLSWVQFNSKLDALDTKLNIDNLTPADYTVMLSNVPVEQMTDEEIIHEFEMSVHTSLHGETSQPVKIKKIVHAYDLTPYTEKVTELRDLRRQKRSIDTYREAYKKRGTKMGHTVTEDEISKVYPESCKDCDYKKISERIQELTKVLDEYNHLDASKITKLGIVFVTFSHTLSDDISDKYRVGPISYLLGWSGYQMRHSQVMVEEAPEAQDVQWDNLGTSFLNRTCRVILNWFILLVILIICLVANIFVSQKNKQYADEAGDNKAFLIALSIIFSAITMFINMVLCFAIPVITSYERLSTATGYDSSVAFKLSFALFLNSAIIPIITYQKQVYFTDGGFLMTIWLNWLCICFLNPIFDVFDIWYWMDMCKWSRIKKEGENCLLTQREANIALEPYQIYLPTKFAQTINIMFYTAFYMILFPAGIIITIAGYFIQYWLTKYLMITRYSVPKCSGDIAMYSMDLIGGVCLCLFLVFYDIMLLKKDIWGSIFK